MNNRSEYHSKVAAMRQTLNKQFPSGSLHIASTANGRVCGASIEIAATCIIQGSHVVASEAAVLEHEKEMALRRSASQPVDSLEAARKLYAAITAGGKDKAR